MSDKRDLCSSGVATVRKPRLVLVGTVAGKLSDAFRKLDWDLYSVPAGSEIACSVLARRPSAVILPIETGWESGYLLAAKLRSAKPKLKVVLVTPTRHPEAERFARFVGAALVAETDGTNRLVRSVTG
jgi:hypothetical protein